jgi:hypothetical protein
MPALKPEDIVCFGVYAKGGLVAVALRHLPTHSSSGAWPTMDQATQVLTDQVTQYWEREAKHLDACCQNCCPCECHDNEDPCDAPPAS